MTKEKKTSQTSMGARWTLNLLAPPPPPHSQMVRDEQSAKCKVVLGMARYMGGARQYHRQGGNPRES